MSYILEAIKKLEQQRQQEGSPNVLTLQDGTGQVRKKRLLWPYAAAGVILLNGVAVLSLPRIIPWRNTEPLPKTVPASVPAASKDPQQNSNRGEVALSDQKKAGQPDTNLADAPLNPRAAATPLQTGRALGSRPDKAIPGIPPGVIKPAPSKGRPITMQDLPEGLKGSLPELKMTVHSYGEHSGSRFAIINNQSLKEGQFLIPELKLERITPDGAILSYHGNHFLLGIN